MHPTRSNSGGGLPPEAQNCTGTVVIVVYWSGPGERLHSRSGQFSAFYVFFFTRSEMKLWIFLRLSPLP
ncbi:MAG TPA: hypothetical protein PK992_20170, partial [Planctomycetaceae bacterium]|nr:hypothetical protein [Planctomycetaceae bacterium]